MVKITDKSNFDEIAKKGFKITHRKGFHIRFKNGWTVSVQFGVGNYCENYNNPVEEFSQLGKFDYASDDAEVWSWNQSKHYPKDPMSNQSPEQVLKFMNKIKRKKDTNLAKDKEGEDEN